MSDDGSSALDSSSSPRMPRRPRVPSSSLDNSKSSEDVDDFKTTSEARNWIYGPARASLKKRVTIRSPQVSPNPSLVDSKVCHRNIKLCEKKSRINGLDLTTETKKSQNLKIDQK